MRRTNNTPRTALVVLVGVVFVSGWLPGRWSGWIAGIPQKVFNPLLHSPAMVLGQIFGGDGSEHVAMSSRIDLGDLEYQQWATAAALAQNQQLIQRVQDLEQRVYALNMIREAMDDTEYKVQKARAMRLLRDKQRLQLTINKGSLQGVQEKDIVIGGGGADVQLVGFVQSVDVNTAQVDLICSDAAASLKVALVPPMPGAAATSEWWVQWDEKRQAFVTNEPPLDANIQAESLAYLRSSTHGESMQAHGFAVGQVKSVAKSPNNPDLSLEVLIEPFVDVSKLKEVYVLVKADASQPPAAPNVKEGP